MTSHQRFPLEWPEGWPRTEPHRRVRARYTVEFEKARRELTRELVRLDARNEDLAVLSTNIPIRKDGHPYASYPKITDPGVAVYFWRDGKQHVIACDAWVLVKDNIRAIGLTIEALRAMERSGASGILERAYQGFEALPAPGGEDDWRTVLQVPGCRDLNEANHAYMKLRGNHHPDRGGKAEDFYRINRAIAAAEKELLE